MGAYRSAQSTFSAGSAPFKGSRLRVLRIVSATRSSDCSVAKERSCCVLAILNRASVPEHNSRDFHATSQRECYVLTLLSRASTPFH
eukprot:4544869-Pyramimonas_sp.AAC.1